MDVQGYSSCPSRAGKLLMRTWSDGEAAMIRQLLETYGIPCQVVSDVSHCVLPFSLDGLGEVRILVPAGRIQEARTILAEHRRQGLSVIQGGLRPSDDAARPAKAARSHGSR
jgi:hypothetical protein